MEVISHLYTANGAIPIYKIPYGGSEIAFYMSPVGAPACVSCFEEAAAMGAEKFVFFGCCGILNDEAVENRLIIPTGVIRDEGTSYHYLPPTEELQPDSHSTEVLKSCMEKYGFPYACGKIWTTDAIYRVWRWSIPPCWQPQHTGICRLSSSSMEQTAWIIPHGSPGT